MASTYRAIDPVRVIETTGILHRWIFERFPGTVPPFVRSEQLTIAKDNSARAESIATRNAAARCDPHTACRRRRRASTNALLILGSVSATAVPSRLRHRVG